MALTEAQRLANKKWYDSNKEKKKAAVLAWRSKNRDKHNKHNRDWYYRDTEKAIRITLKHRMKTRYGVTPEQVHQMKVDQEFMCAICRVHEDTLTRGLFIDHDHKTGLVRALLCINCNTALGHVGDDPVILEKMVDYLNEYSHCHPGPACPLPVQ